MPRETVVRGTDYRHTSETPNGSSVEHRQNPDLEVNWNREGEWVQLGVVIDRNSLLERIASEHPEQNRIAIPTEVLDRKQINHLIRTLRRARDASYGADE